MEDFLPEDIDPTMWEPDQSTGCMIWQGSLDNNFYIKYRHKGKRTYLHRVIYENEHGEIPDGYRITWSCPNHRLCINHSHLMKIHKQANLQANRKLTTEQVSRIKIDDRPAGILAKVFNVSVGTIYAIRAGRVHMEVDPALTEVEKLLKDIASRARG